ncbi:MAG: FKBP-type peptidyl-prolyl cis-trans isomerase [Eubacterium sp.]|nr:FKBP-type peptidyl-prolyl cis-trans isomerase [Eubacterium sp.]
MKKQYLLVGLLFVMMAVLTGCSWEDIKSKFVGQEAASGSAVTGAAISGPVIIEDYNVDEVVTLGEYKGIEVDCRVTDADLETEKNNFLSQHVKESKIKKGKVTSGCSINIDFTGKVDGKEFDGGSAEDYEVVAGNSGFINGFDEGLLTMKVGETKDLNLQFPTPYVNNPDLAGKPVVFTVKVNHIVKTEKRPWNDAYVKKYSDEGYKTVAEWTKETKKTLKKNKENNISSTALGTAIQNATINSLPATLKLAYTKYYDQLTRLQVKQQYGESIDFETVLGMQGTTKEQYQQYIDYAGENYATQQVVCEAIAKKENITFTDDDVKKFVEEQTGATYEEGKTQYESTYGADAAMTYDDMNKNYYLITKIMDFLKENAKIIK